MSRRRGYLAPILGVLLIAAIASCESSDGAEKEPDFEKTPPTFERHIESLKKLNLDMSKFDMEEAREDYKNFPKIWKHFFGMKEQALCFKENRDDASCPRSISLFRYKKGVGKRVDAAFAKIDVPARCGIIYFFQEDIPNGGDHFLCIAGSVVIFLGSVWSL